MRALIIFILSCAAGLGAETGIHVFTTAKTNAETGSISTKEVFTRDGQTNLVRNTTTKAGEVQVRIHHFYRGGQLVGDVLELPDSSGFITHAGFSYSVAFEFDSSRNPASVAISTKDGVLLDMFSYTNGGFVPIESSVIRKTNEKAKAMNADLEQLFDPKHLRETPSEAFAREAEELVEKHNAK
jgi:hypothetical protein